MMQLRLLRGMSLPFWPQELRLLLQAGAAKTSSTNIVNTASTLVSTDSPYDRLSFSDPTNPDQDDSEIPALEDIYKNPTDGIFTNSSYDDEGAVADFTNLEPVVNVSPIPTSRINYIHPSTLILGDPQSAVQTRSKVTKSSRAHAFFKIQKVWILVDLPYGKKAIGTKWVYRNKKDERGVVVRNKARLVAQGHRQEEGIDMMRCFVLWPGLKHMIFFSLSMILKSAFLICAKLMRECLCVSTTRAWYATLSTFLLKNGYKRGTIDKTLFIKKDKHDILLVQVYVDDIIFGSTKKSWCDEFEALMQSRFQMSSIEILKKFDFLSMKTASTPIETQKPLSLLLVLGIHQCHSKRPPLKVQYRNHKVSKVKPKLAVWYLRVSSFDLESYLDSDYAGANLDRKSTTGADLLTKAFDVSRFQFLVVTIGMINP
ncbi:putative ribonuclease H-like domain-containing protein [Tanacetum coccineum]